MTTYTIDYIGEKHDRPCVRRSSDGKQMTQAFPPRTKLELVQVNGRHAVDIWLWKGGYHSFHSTHYLD